MKAYLADYVEGMQWLYKPENRQKAIELTAELTKSPREALESYFLLPGKDYYRDRNGCVSRSLVAADGRCAGRQRAVAIAGRHVKARRRLVPALPCN